MKITSFVFTVLLLLIAAGAYAQGVPQGNGATPIDGGATLLLAGAAAYGYKRYRDSRNK